MQLRGDPMSRAQTASSRTVSSRDDIRMSSIKTNNWIRSGLFLTGDLFIPESEINILFHDKDIVRVEVHWYPY